MNDEENQQHCKRYKAVQGKREKIIFTTLPEEEV